MRLKNLELNGFKSFAKKTVLEFEHGIVAIVGPNGSGKSNVVEALRFVLGEQSMKSMRGSSGSDLIFKGSKTLSKSSRASVTIYFDNSDKTTTVVMEILGMDETFQKTFSSSEFIEIVPFPNKPKYGWAIHPIVLEIEHEELGHVQLKTEIHLMGEPVPPVIYSTP